MNKQIKELFEQAKAESSQWLGSKPAIAITYDELEKFAELIVKECANVFWSEDCNTSDLALEEYNRNSKKIKKHFGVEE